MASQKKHAISTQAIFLLLALAIFFDALQAGVDLMHAIPVVGNAAAIIFTTLIDVWAYLSIWFGFKLAAPSISFVSPKRALALNGALLIELIPIINMLPAWTLAVVIIVLTSRAEDTIVETLEKTGKMMGTAGKLAGAASKLAPNPAMRKSLAKVSQGAQGVSQFAQAKAQQARSLGQTSAAGAQSTTTSPQISATRQITPPTSKTPRESPYQKGKAYIDSGRDYIRKDKEPTSTPKAAPTPQSATTPQKEVGDIGAPPIFRQPQSTIAQQPKEARENPYAKGKAYIDTGRDYIRKDLGKEYEKGRSYIGQGADFVRSGTNYISPKPTQGTAARKTSPPQSPPAPARKESPPVEAKPQSRTTPPSTTTPRPTTPSPSAATTQEMRTPTKATSEATPTRPSTSSSEKHSSAQNAGQSTGKVGTEPKPQGGAITPPQSSPLNRGGGEKERNDSLSKMTAPQAPVSPSMAMERAPRNEAVSGSTPREQSDFAGQAAGNRTSPMSAQNVSARGRFPEAKTSGSGVPFSATNSHARAGQKINGNAPDFRKAMNESRKKLRDDLAKAIEAIQKGKKLP